MLDPLAPTTGLVPRLLLAAVLTVLVWACVGWALLA
jgi:hypothetical protein